jgi:TRAP-type C4-dicarboxylate transport system permease small subunit
MSIVQIEHIIGKVSEPIARWLNYAAGFFLAAMMALTGADVAMRYFLNSPIPGSFEIIQYMMPMVVALGLAACACKEGHVRVDLITSMLPERTQQVLKSVSYFIMTVVFFLISWQSIVRAKGMMASGQYTEVLYLPIYPFVFVVTLGGAALCLVALKLCLHYLNEAVKP